VEAVPDHLLADRAAERREGFDLARATERAQAGRLLAGQAVLLSPGARAAAPAPCAPADRALPGAVRMRRLGAADRRGLHSMPAQGREGRCSAPQRRSPDPAPELAACAMSAGLRAAEADRGAGLEALARHAGGRLASDAPRQPAGASAPLVVLGAGAAASERAWATRALPPGALPPSCGERQVQQGCYGLLRSRTARIATLFALLGVLACLSSCAHDWSHAECKQHRVAMLLCDSRGLTLIRSEGVWSVVLRVPSFTSSKPLSGAASLGWSVLRALGACARAGTPVRARAWLVDALLQQHADLSAHVLFMSE